MLQLRWHPAWTGGHRPVAGVWFHSVVLGLLALLLALNPTMWPLLTPAPWAEVQGLGGEGQEGRGSDHLVFSPWQIGLSVAWLQGLGSADWLAACLQPFPQPQGSLWASEKLWELRPQERGCDSTGWGSEGILGGTPLRGGELTGRKSHVPPGSRGSAGHVLASLLLPLRFWAKHFVPEPLLWAGPVRGGGQRGGH